MSKEQTAHYLANTFSDEERMHLEAAILEALYRAEKGDYREAKS